MSYTVGYLIGSLSKDSINRRFAEALVALAPESVTFVEIPTGDLPLYNRDFDADYPQVAREFKSAIEACDALLYVTPEYNRSVSGSLKNAIDWASRPWGQGSLGRPSAIAGVSAGAVGTAVAQSHLRSILTFFDAKLHVQPELYVQWNDGLVEADGSFAAGSRDFFQAWMDSFVAFLDQQVTKA